MTVIDVSEAIGGFVAGVDNVARVIAAASALGTACNMAVGYANYRRKRPTAALRMSWSQWGKFYEGHLVEMPLFELHLENESESPLKVISVHLERTGAIRRRDTLRRSRRIRRADDLIPEDDLNTSPYDQVDALPWTLDGFTPLNWHASLRCHTWCRYSSFDADDKPSYLRARVWLSGRRSVATPWERVPEFMWASGCPVCSERAEWGDPDQLSFDDL
ncbi:hypothetical protein ACWGK6_36600 [Streptomyces violaceusniger]